MQNFDFHRSVIDGPSMTHRWDQRWTAMAIDELRWYLSTGETNPSTNDENMFCVQKVQEKL